MRTIKIGKIEMKTDVRPNSIKYFEIAWCVAAFLFFLSQFYSAFFLTDLDRFLDVENLWEFFVRLILVPGIIVLPALRVSRYQGKVARFFIVVLWIFGALLSYLFLKQLISKFKEEVKCFLYTIELKTYKK